MTTAIAVAKPVSAASATSLERTSGEQAQARLLAALARPGSSDPIRVVAEEMAGDAVRTGAIFGPDGARIGKIANFQVDFVRPGEGANLASLHEQFRSGALPRRNDLVAERRLVDHADPRIRYTGPKASVSDPTIVVLDQPGLVVSFEVSGETEVLLFAHPWSGEVEVRAAGKTQVVDLYTPHTIIPRPLTLELGASPTRVEIALTGRRNPLSSGAQCVFGGFRELTGREVPLRCVKSPRVRGAAFDAAFEALMAGVPEQGILLDVGGGNRQIDDARYINCDYADYHEPDLIADATRLPLRDASVDAVYSTGVFEHIVDPAKAGEEVARVLKPGGRAVIAWAFMQPIHSEGQHFYNATPWGVERAFAKLKLERMWYDTSFAFLVRWGASVSGLEGRVPQSEIDAICQTLSRWDGLIPDTHKSYMANGVWAVFEKA